MPDPTPRQNPSGENGDERVPSGHRERTQEGAASASGAESGEGDPLRQEENENVGEKLAKEAVAMALREKNPREVFVQFRARVPEEAREKYSRLFFGFLIEQLRDQFSKEVDKVYARLGERVREKGSAESVPELSHWRQIREIAEVQPKQHLAKLPLTLPAEGEAHVSFNSPAWPLLVLRVWLGDTNLTLQDVVRGVAEGWVWGLVRSQQESLSPHEDAFPAQAEHGVKDAVHRIGSLIAQGGIELLIRDFEETWGKQLDALLGDYTDGFSSAPLESLGRVSERWQEVASAHRRFLQRVDSFYEKGAGRVAYACIAPLRRQVSEKLENIKSLSRAEDVASSLRSVSPLLQQLSEGVGVYVAFVGQLKERLQAMRAVLRKEVVDIVSLRESLAHYARLVEEVQHILQMWSQHELWSKEVADIYESAKQLAEQLRNLRTLSLIPPLAQEGLSPSLASPFPTEEGGLPPSSGTPAPFSEQRYDEFEQYQKTKALLSALILTALRNKRDIKGARVTPPLTLEELLSPSHSSSLTI